MLAKKLFLICACLAVVFSAPLEGNDTGDIEKTTVSNIEEITVGDIEKNTVNNNEETDDCDDSEESSSCEETSITTTPSSNSSNSSNSSAESSCDEDECESDEITENNNPMQYGFEKLLFNVGNAIQLIQKKVLVKIGDKLNSTEFLKGVNLLHESAALVYGNVDEDLVDEEKKNEIKLKQKKVSELFKKLSDEALDAYEQNKDGTVDAVEFQHAAEELRTAMYSLSSKKRKNLKKDDKARK